MGDYIIFNCPECGEPLVVWSEFLIKQDGFYIHKHLIRHCDNCLRDWENEWYSDFGDVTESALRLRFWG